MVKLARDAIDQSEGETHEVSLRAHTLHIVEGLCFRTLMEPPPRENFLT